MVSIKSKREIELMREAGRIVALAHKAIAENIKPGITTYELNNIAEKVIIEAGASPSFKGYSGFPAAICASPNEEVVHGIPNDKELEEGDILSVDIGAYYKGYHGDSAWTYPVGKISEEKQHLLLATEKALWSGLEVVKAGIYLSDISNAIEISAKENKLGIVKELAGHGIGKELHEDPLILNYGKPGNGIILKENMVLAIEPMLNLGTSKIKFLKDGWSTKTKDGKPSAHFEHTIVVTEEGYEILTKL